MNKSALFIPGVAFSHSLAFSQACLPDTTLVRQGCMPEGIIFNTQAQIDSFQVNYPGCTHFEGPVLIEGDDISNLNGLNVVTSYGGDLYIYSNVGLTSMTGLDNLNTIGRDFRIYMNPALPNLPGLENLNSIGRYLDICYNDALTSLLGLESLTSIGGDLRIAANNALTNLSGLEGVTSIGGSLMFWDGFTGNPVLTSLMGLERVTSIVRNLEIVNINALTSLTGLDNLDAGSINGLYIYNNNSLSTCEVQSVCKYLAIPNGNINIWGNAYGCNSPEEVEVACNEVSVESIGFEDEYLLFPNPAGKTVTISGNNGAAIREIHIYNQTGQKVLKSKPVNNTLDVSKLRPGMYFVELVTDQRKVREKLVVE